MARPSPLLESGNVPHVIVSDGTPQVLVDLAAYPDALVTCIFGHDRQSSKHAAMAIWYMHVGCVALHGGSRSHISGLRDFKVQPLCVHHNDRQEPLEGIDLSSSGQTAGLTAPAHLLSGAHLLVDLTIGNNSSFPAETWANSGPHWSDTAGPDGDPLPPALELGYGMDTLTDFANTTDLGRLVFSGCAHLLA